MEEVVPFPIECGGGIEGRLPRLCHAVALVSGGVKLQLGVLLGQKSFPNTILPVPR
jgi:hypothetical protein